MPKKIFYFLQILFKGWQLDRIVKILHSCKILILLSLIPTSPVKCLHNCWYLAGPVRHSGNFWWCFLLSFWIITTLIIIVFNDISNSGCQEQGRSSKSVLIFHEILIELEVLAILFLHSFNINRDWSVLTTSYSGCCLVLGYLVLTALPSLPIKPVSKKSLFQTI